MGATSVITRAAGTAMEADATLPDELLNLILVALDRQDEPTPDDPGRRAWPRFVLRKCMAIVPYDPKLAAEPVTVWLRDISRGGIGLIHANRLPMDSQFLLEISTANGKKVRLVCAVIYCDALHEGYTIGARFKRVLASE